MQVNVNGVWTQMPDSTPLFVAFDPTLTANPSGVGYNQGCPPGYFMELASPWNVPADLVTDLSASSVRVCRLMDSQIVNDGGATIAAESGPSAQDQNLINIAAAASSVVGGAGSILNTVGTALSPVLLLLLAVGAFMLSRGGRTVVIEERKANPKKRRSR